MAASAAELLHFSMRNQHILAATVLAILLGKITAGIVIISVIIINTIIGFIQEYQASNAIHGLLKLIPDGKSHRNPEVNETTLLICHINKKLGHKKTGETSLKELYSGLVHLQGFEPQTFSSVVRCSIQLSYKCISVSLTDCKSSN